MFSISCLSTPLPHAPQRPGLSVEKTQLQLEKIKVQHLPRNITKSALWGPQVLRAARICTSRSTSCLLRNPRLPQIPHLPRKLHFTQRAAPATTSVHRIKIHIVPCLQSVSQQERLQNNKIQAAKTQLSRAFRQLKPSRVQRSQFTPATKSESADNDQSAAPETKSAFVRTTEAKTHQDRTDTEPKHLCGNRTATEPNYSTRETEVCPEKPLN